MLDDKLLDNLRLVWGFRYEHYHNVVNTFSDNGDPTKVDNTYKDFLPSANLIYSVLPKANLRLSYSKTVARPLYRELAYLLFYDFLTNSTFFGNPSLTESEVYNYEIRWEHFFEGSQYYSISGFYKRFHDPIESYIAISGADSRTIGFKNVDRAKNYGVELEGRKNFGFISKYFENLVAYANVSFIKSETNEHTSAKDSSFRPLQGQSPYVVNASLQYNDPKTGISVSLLYNVMGPRLSLVGGLDQEPVWEKAHANFDIKIGKTFLKNGTIDLTFADLLHKDDVQYWDLNNSKYHKFQEDGTDRIIQRQNFGYTISLEVGYRF
jgi:outer membrane receptor protein involved in Fe transport